MQSASGQVADVLIPVLETRKCKMLHNHRRVLLEIGHEHTKVERKQGNLRLDLLSFVFAQHQRLIAQIKRNMNGVVVLKVHREGGHDNKGMEIS